MRRGYGPNLEENSDIGIFKGTLNSTKGSLVFAEVDIECCSFTFYKKIVEAIQPVLEELKEEMSKQWESEGDDCDNI